MRNVCDKVGLQDLRRAQLARHKIEVFVKLLHLADAALLLDARVDAPRRDASHRTAESCDRPEEDKAQNAGRRRTDGGAEEQNEQKHPRCQPAVKGKVDQRDDQNGERDRADELEHDEKKKIQPKAEAALFLLHARTTLYPTPRMVTILISLLSRSRSRSLPICTSTVCVSVSVS